MGEETRNPPGVPELRRPDDGDVGVPGSEPELRWPDDGDAGVPELRSRPDGGREVAVAEPQERAPCPGEARRTEVEPGLVSLSDPDAVEEVPDAGVPEPELRPEPWDMDGAVEADLDGALREEGVPAVRRSDPDDGLGAQGTDPDAERDRLERENRILRARVQALMREKAEALRTARYWRRRAERAGRRGA